MAYNIIVNLLPSGCSFYVKADASNPSTIETSATLKFYADGTYYILNSDQTAAVSVSGASVDSWTRVSNTEGILVISNPTGDVTVNLIARQVVTPLSYNRPFDITAKAPVDTRIVLTKKQMAELADGKMPDYYFCICKDDSKLYIYDKSLTEDATLGKFRPIDNYLTFTSEEAKAQLNTAISNSVKIAAIDQDIEELEEDVTQAQDDIDGIQSWINNVKLDGGEIKAYYTLTANYTNVTPDVAPTQIEYNKDLTITFTANTGYQLPDVVTVNGKSVGSEQVNCGRLQAKWIKSTGKLYLIKVVDDVSYTVTGVAEE